jgi:hypothetical protein
MSVLQLDHGRLALGGRRHELRFSVNSNLATCRCGDWSLTNIKRPMTEETVKRDFQLHKQNASASR